MDALIAVDTEILASSPMTAVVSDLLAVLQSGELDTLICSVHAARDLMSEACGGPMAEVKPNSAGSPCSEFGRLDSASP